MSGSPFLDTNVLVYALGQDDRRTPVAETLLADGGTISVQVLNELVAVMQRKLRMPLSDILDALASLRVLCPSSLPVTADIHEAALSLIDRYGWHVYDAVIVATALAAGCSTLYSEDLQHGQIINDQLTIVNPFAPR